jgi:tetratricopeptide (TPR) repeat protein
MAQRMAPHLGVRDLGELYGPAVTLSLDGQESHAGIGEVRQALTAWHLTAAGEPSSPEYLRGAVDAAWQTWHSSRHQRTEAGLLLPGLLTETQRAVRLLDGVDRRRAQTSLAQAYHLAQAYLAWHGDRELCWLTVDRGMTAAIESDDPLALAQAAWYASHLLRAVGRSDEALARLREAQAIIDPYVADGGPEYAEALADIYLASALTRARVSDQGAWADWEQASAVVHRALPADYVGLRTRVSRPLVEVYAVMCAVELGDPDEARRRAHNLDPQSIPSTERRARHYVELARAADLEGGQEAALHLLSTAEATSPETVQFSPAGRDIISRLVEQGPAAIRADATALAVRANVPI